jgi:hypothetical protein
MNFTAPDVLFGSDVHCTMTRKFMNFTVLYIYSHIILERTMFSFNRTALFNSSGFSLVNSFSIVIDSFTACTVLTGHLYHLTQLRLTSRPMDRTQ